MEKLDIGARVIKLSDDKTHAFGMTILTDDGKRALDYTEYDDCKLYSFPLNISRRRSDKLVLYSIKMRKKY